MADRRGSGEDDGHSGRRWERNREVHAVDLDGESVIYDGASGRLHVLNPSASVIWSCLDGSLSDGELVSELSIAFDVELETMAKQVTDVLSALAAEGLIRPDGRQLPAPVAQQAP